MNLEGKISGAEISLLLLVAYLRDKYHLKIACPCGSALAERMSCLGVDCYGLPTPTSDSYYSLRQLFVWLKISCCLIWIILKTKARIVHANSIYAALASALPAFITQRILIWHSRDFSKRGLICKICSLFCRKVIAVSYTVRDSLVSQGVKPDKIGVIYNGTKINNALQSPKKKPLLQVKSENNQGKFVFANIGQFVSWKKQIVFLKAASKIATKIPNAKFMLVGDDIFGRDQVYKKRLLEYIRRSTIFKKVKLLGWQDNLGLVWPKIDCVVHTAEREPFGRVIIEAMAHKVPVIAVNRCGPSEIIENDVTGILVPPGDIQKLSEAMLGIALDPKLAEQLTDAAYKHVISNFTAGKAAEHVKEIYETVLAA